jgi:hypothetical protein
MTAPLFELLGFLDRHDVTWYVGALHEANPFLAANHYLGALTAGGANLVVIGRQCGGPVVACQVWRPPTSRNLPADGSWLELSRWCLTPDAGPNAGSRNHRYAVRLLRDQDAKTLVSYSDPSNGHTGALYRACNWMWAPTWHRLRPPPTGNGSWQPGVIQSVKDRWVFHVAKRDPARAALRVDDQGAVRHWQATATAYERAWARRSDYMREVTA